MHLIFKQEAFFKRLIKAHKKIVSTETHKHKIYLKPPFLEIPMRREVSYWLILSAQGVGQFFKGPEYYISHNIRKNIKM